MRFETILLEKEDHIATLTLNRPERLNAINLQMFDEILAALENVDEDDDVRVLILTGAGRAFSSSADMKDGGGEPGKRLFPDLTINEIREDILRVRPQRVTRNLINLRKPTIAMVNGLAIGDGFDWCLACDLRIASTEARFMNAFTKLALFPNTGGTWLLPRVLGLGKALELMYTGDWLEPEEAYRLGMLNRLVPPEELVEETLAIARKIASGPPASLRLMKLQTYRSLEITLDAALELAADGEALMLATNDHVEALSAWFEKREPKFTGK